MKTTVLAVLFALLVGLSSFIIAQDDSQDTAGTPTAGASLWLADLSEVIPVSEVSVNAHVFGFMSKVSVSHLYELGQNGEGDASSESDDSNQPDVVLSKPKPKSSSAKGGNAKPASSSQQKKTTTKPATATATKKTQSKSSSLKKVNALSLFAAATTGTKESDKTTSGDSKKTDSKKETVKSTKDDKKAEKKSEKKEEKKAEVKNDSKKETKKEEKKEDAKDAKDKKETKKDATQDAKKETKEEAKQDAKEAKETKQETKQETKEGETKSETSTKETVQESVVDAANATAAAKNDTAIPSQPVHKKTFLGGEPIEEPPFLGAVKGKKSLMFLLPLRKGLGILVDGFEVIVNGVSIFEEESELYDYIVPMKSIAMMDFGAEGAKVDRDMIALIKQGIKLDETATDLLVFKIGPVSPNAVIQVKVTYVRECPLRSGRIKFSIPKHLIPTVVDSWDYTAQKLLIKTNFVMHNVIKNIISPNYEAIAKLNGNTATVVYIGKKLSLYKDFTLYIEVEDLFLPHALLEADSSASQPPAIMVAFAPKLDKKLKKAEPTKEIHILMDCAHEMGHVMHQTREAVDLLLKSLPTAAANKEVRFNMYKFCSVLPGGFHRLFDNETAVFNEESYVKSVNYLTDIKPAGSSEILSALNQIFTTNPAENTIRNILVVTNGGCTSDPAAVLKLATEHRNDTRFFTIGLGSARIETFLHELATAGLGKFEMVIPGDDVQPKLIRQLKRAMIAPRFSSITLSLSFVSSGENLNFEYVSNNPGSIYEGDRRLVYARFNKNFDIQSLDPNSEVIIRFETDAHGMLMFTVPVSSMIKIKGTVVHAMTGMSRIRELRRGLDSVSPSTIARKELKSEIVDLALRNGFILPGYTGAWGFARGYKFSLKLVAQSEAELIHEFDGAALASLQDWEGYWSLSPEFARAIQVSYSALNAKKPEKCSVTISRNSPSGPVTGDFWATSVAVASLQVTNSDIYDEFEFVIQKALAWMQKQGNSTVEACINKAKEGLLHGYYAQLKVIPDTAELNSHKGGISRHRIRKTTDAVIVTLDDEPEHKGRAIADAPKSNQKSNKGKSSQPQSVSSKSTQVAGNKSTQSTKGAKQGKSGAKTTGKTGNKTGGAKTKTGDKKPKTTAAKSTKANTKPSQ